MQPSSLSGSGRARPDYDQALKWMLTQAHDAFLALIAPGLIWRGERSPEVPAVARRADLVWEVELPGGGRGLLHIELQIKVGEEIGERLAEYAIRLWRRDHLPVRSVVIFLREAPDVPASPFVIPWGENDESLRYHFEVIRLWEIPQERVLASPTYDLWPLSALMAGANTETTLATAERLAQIPAPRQERSDLIGALVGLAGIRGARDALLAALRRNHMLEELLKESGILQELAQEYAQEYAKEYAAEIVAKELAKERAEAEAKGLAEGKVEGEREMARIALEGRFGSLPEDLLTALRAADPAILTEIVAQLATISLDQARARLGLP